MPTQYKDPLLLPVKQSVPAILVLLSGVHPQRLSVVQQELYQVHVTIQTSLHHQVPVVEVALHGAAGVEQLEEYGAVSGRRGIEQDVVSFSVFVVEVNAERWRPVQQEVEEIQPPLVHGFHQDGRPVSCGTQLGPSSQQQAECLDVSACGEYRHRLGLFHYI